MLLIECAFKWEQQSTVRKENKGEIKDVCTSTEQVSN